MDIASFTSVGLVRKNNEDSYLVLPPWSRLAIKTRICAFGVADGMGGESSGEIASDIATKGAKNWISSFSSEFLTVVAVEEMFSCINNEIWEYANKYPEAKGMGTTFSIIVFKGKTAIVGHIGDSRLYRKRAGAWEQLTKDHSLVAEQVKLGKITPEEARTHSTRHILSRVLGGKQFVTPDVFELEVENEDMFLMCTDGVYGMLEDAAIKKIVNAGNVLKIPKDLIEASNKAGGKDNSTVIAFKIDAMPLNIPGYFSIERLRCLFRANSMTVFI